MEGLSFDNILGEQDIENLFMEPEDNTETSTTEAKEEEETSPKEKNIETKKKTTTEVVDPETLFEEEEEEEVKQPESVGSEKKEDKEKGSAATDEGSDTSPENFYSSIANALAVDGAFPNLDEETVSKVDDAQSFSDLIEAEALARFDEKQQKLVKALENGVEPNDIRRYEATIRYIDSITTEAIEKEDDAGEQLRRNIIYQDFINKGYTEEKAKKMTDRTVEAGTDLEDAKEALQSNKEFFQKEYDKLLNEAQKKADKEKAEIRKKSEKLKEELIDSKNPIGDMEISKEMRKKAFDSVSKPTYKDSETGEYLTAIQKYELEHPVDFMKYVGLFFTLTNGFKDFKSFIKPEVKKETKKGLEALEHTLNTTKRAANGNLKLVTKVDEDPNSYFGRGFQLDI